MGSSDIDIKIFVATHKKVDCFDSDLLQLVQVGSENAAKRIPGIYHDDDGESISALNAQYCELTAQYWAWKNVEADYYGFCHYRRYFDFSSTDHPENDYGDVVDQYISLVSQEKYALYDDAIREALADCDVLSTEMKDLRQFPSKASTPYAHYKEAPHLHIEDLDLMLEVIAERCPDYLQDAEEYLHGHYSCFCNMYVMRSEIFHEYCGWLFPILEIVRNRMNAEHYSREAMRTLGHLAERLFNIFMLHHRRCGAGWQWRQVQCVRFECPEPLLLDSGIAEGDMIVPVALAANDAYVPMLATTLFSMLKNASEQYRYDVVVLHQDISSAHQEDLRWVFRRFENATIRFVNVGRFVEGYLLATNNPHISIETYYRFLIQDVFPDYNKAIYLDSDLIVEGDVSELFETALEDNLLAAVRDIECLGNLSKPNSVRMKYNEDVLHMRDPYRYFQAGVLVLNLAELRAMHSRDEWLNLATRAEYIYNDQDILNVECEEKVIYLDMSWNVMTDCNDRYRSIFSFAPADVFLEFTHASQCPKIIHYAGFEKPWKMSDCDQGVRYWAYAQQIPFYPELLKEFVNSKSNAGTIKTLVKKAGAILPEGSWCRKFAKRVYFRVVG